MTGRFGLARYRPYSAESPMERTWDRFLGHSWRWYDWPTYAWRTPASEETYTAPVELMERDGQHVIRMELPGVEMSDINISITEGVLTVKGEKKHEEEVKEGGFYRSERSYGSFCRSMSVPEGLDESKVSATLDNGILEVLLPKPAEKLEHTVTVKPKAKLMKGKTEK